MFYVKIYQEVQGCKLCGIFINRKLRGTINARYILDFKALPRNKPALQLCGFLRDEEPTGRPSSPDAHRLTPRPGMHDVDTDSKVGPSRARSQVPQSLESPSSVHPPVRTRKGHLHYGTTLDVETKRGTAWWPQRYKSN